MNFGFLRRACSIYNKPLSEKLFEAQKRSSENRRKGNCVIVGRNANTILKEFDYGLHVFVHADPCWRAERMKSKMPDANETKINEEIRAIDRTRKKYCSYYTNTEFGVADYYDICLSTSSLGIDACVEILEKLAK